MAARVSASEECLQFPKDFCQICPQVSHKVTKSIKNHRSLFGIFIGISFANVFIYLVRSFFLLEKEANVMARKWSYKYKQTEISGP